MGILELNNLKLAETLAKYISSFKILICDKKINVMIFFPLKVNLFELNEVSLFFYS